MKVERVGCGFMQSSLLSFWGSCLIKIKFKHRSGSLYFFGFSKWNSELWYNDKFYETDLKLFINLRLVIFMIDCVPIWKWIICKLRNLKLRIQHITEFLLCVHVAKVIIVNLYIIFYFDVIFLNEFSVLISNFVCEMYFVD